MVIHHAALKGRVQWGGGRWEHAPPSAFYTLAWAISLNRGATFLHLAKTMYCIILFIKNTCAPPPLRITQLRPCCRGEDVGFKYDK